jgi:hypothetical protein
MILIILIFVITVAIIEVIILAELDRIRTQKIQSAIEKNQAKLKKVDDEEKQRQHLRSLKQIDDVEI